MQKRNIEILVGGFVLLGFVGLVFLALKAANLGTMTSSGGSYLLNARFDNIGGLKAKAAIRTAGVVVGRVENIELDEKTFQARVTIAMDKRYAFPKDSSLKILTSGLLGEQYVGLEAGADADNLVAGDTIGATQSAVVLENLISQFLYSKAAEGGSGESSSK
jgi:phospholipid/cholesterol/gamma-HCH transport system substrate-binding protein